MYCGPTNFTTFEVNSASFCNVLRSPCAPPITNWPSLMVGCFHMTGLTYLNAWEIPACSVWKALSHIMWANPTHTSHGKTQPTHHMGKPNPLGNWTLALALKSFHAIDSAAQAGPTWYISISVWHGNVYQMTEVCVWKRRHNEAITFYAKCTTRLCLVLSTQNFKWN